MSSPRLRVPRPGTILALIALVTTALLPMTIRAQAAVPSTVAPTWSNNVEGWVQRGSVALGNVDGDPEQEIFVGTNAGLVYGFNPNGSSLPGWPVNVLGRVGGAPAIGDITGDGVAEVIVGSGWGAADAGLTGGIWAFSANGTQLWRKVTQNAPGTNIPNGVFASPVLVDLNGDGVLDVLAASYDENIYALRGNGQSVFPGALPASAGNRNDALIWLGDSPWATPAVGDVDGDGVVDIVVASATNIDARLSYVYPGWNDQEVLNACAKTPQTPSTIDRSQRRACGLVAVFSNNGRLKPGWPKFIPGHTYDASPTLANLDGDDQLEIVTGNGWDPTFGDASQPLWVRIWSHDGQVQRQFNIDAAVFESGPAIGDITGDGRPEIVVGTNPFVPSLPKANANKIFAFDSSLNLLPGFPVDARDAQFNQVASPSAISLADVSGDGAADIIFGTTWDVRAINGSGQYLNANLVIHGTGPFGGQPAIGNIDGDPQLELVFAAARGFSPGVVHKFDLGVAADPSDLPWPQFHANAFHTGALVAPELRVPTGVGTITAGQERRFALPIGDTVGGGLTWSATASADWIKLGATSGRTRQDPLQVTLDASSAPFSGGVASGTITVTSGGSSKSIPVRLVRVDQIRATLYLPLTRNP